MADAGGGEQEGEHVETQRKMSEPAQPGNNHSSQAQTSEASKKSSKKKGKSLRSAVALAQIKLKGREALLSI